MTCAETRQVDVPQLLHGHGGHPPLGPQYDGAFPEPPSPWQISYALPHAAVERSAAALASIVDVISAGKGNEAAVPGPESDDAPSPAPSLADGGAKRSGA
jgi:hypothetical protein